MTTYATANSFCRGAEGARLCARFNGSSLDGSAMVAKCTVRFYDNSQPAISNKPSKNVLDSARFISVDTVYP